MKDNTIKEMLTNSLIASIFNRDDRKLMIKMFWKRKEELGITKDDLKTFANTDYNAQLSELIMGQIKNTMHDDSDFVMKFIGTDINTLTNDEKSMIKKLSFVPDSVKEKILND